jgi:hypothetical protein
VKPRITSKQVSTLWARTRAAIGFVESQPTGGRNSMWVLVQPGQALKIDGGPAMVQVIPMSDVTVLPTAPASVPPPPPTGTATVPMQVTATSPVTAQVVHAP